MEQPAIRIPLSKLRAFVAILCVFLALVFAGPALAEYLGPDRVTVEFKEVRDPDNDVWTMTRGADVCLIIHTCEEHPSVVRQQALCGWTADNSGCDRAYKIKEVTVVLPEATIGSDLQGCTLVDGWCTDTPTLHLVGTEPVTSETITLIEGTRNGEPFACPGAVCDVPLVQGGNQLTFWALSSWGDSSQMGTLSAQVDSKGPKVSIPDSWYIWEPLAIQVEDAQHGIDKVTLDIDGGEYGDRSYSWAGSVVPDDFIWDRHFGEIIAPIGDYRVTVRARDGLGNISTASGEIVIPDPGSADDGAGGPAPPLSTGDGLDSAEDLAWLIDPYPLPSSGVAGAGDESGPAAAVAESAEQPASALSGSANASAQVGAVPSGATTEGGGTGLLWGAAALAAAASATAYGLSRRKARLDYIREMRERAAEMSSPEARQARLTSIWNAAQARVAPIRAAMASVAASSRAAAASAVAATAAAAAEARRRIDEALRQRAKQRRGEREQRLKQAEQSTPTPAFDMAKWKQQDYAQSEAWARDQGYQAYREQEHSSGPAPSRPGLLPGPLQFISRYADVAKNALRGFSVYNLVQAARRIDIRQVTTTLRITGPRASRNTIGLREMVNWARPENVRLLPQSPTLRAVRSLRSWGTAFGIGLNLAADTHEFIEGNYDRHEYAASLTIDTGITIGITLAAGAFAGAVTGAVVGFVGGGVTVPILGSIPGAVLGGVIGGVAGIGAAIGLSAVVEATGVREFLVERVTDLYRSWTNQTSVAEPTEP